MWIIEDVFDIVSEDNSVWCNKWKHNTAAAAEALIVVDLAQTLV